LLQAGQDVVIFGCGSLSASVRAGQASLGFCLLSFTFITLFSSGWGRTQQLIPCLQQYPVVSGHCNRQSEKNEKYD